MIRIKYIYIAILFLVSSISSLGQTGTVRFIKAVPKRSFNDTKDSVITYPIFLFKNKILTDNVNKSVKYEFLKLYDLNKTKPIKALLQSLANDGLSELDYEEIRSDKKFFSFVIYHEWIAAYPSYHQSYFAFDKTSGKRLTIDDLIIPEMRFAFKGLTINLWKDSLVRYREDLAIQLSNKEIDSTDYETALGYTEDDCLQSYSTTNFKLSKDTLEIFFECPFPRVMLPMAPSRGITIPLRTITKYLKSKYKP
jgi:hypothetical protein